MVLAFAGLSTTTTFFKPRETFYPGDGREPSDEWVAAKRAEIGGRGALCQRRPRRPDGRAAPFPKGEEKLQPRRHGAGPEFDTAGQRQLDQGGEHRASRCAHQSRQLVDMDRGGGGEVEHALEQLRRGLVRRRG